jgi:DNA mismatch repair protein MSH4
MKPDIHHSEQAINNILMLKSFVQSIPPVFEALTGSTSGILTLIRQNCHPQNINPTIELIKEVINDDVTYQKTPLDLRNQRTYAVKVLEPPIFATTR